MRNVSSGLTFRWFNGRGADIFQVDDSVLEALGVSKLMERKRILKQIEELQKEIAKAPKDRKKPIHEWGPEEVAEFFKERAMVEVEIAKLQDAGVRSDHS